LISKISTIYISNSHDEHSPVDTLAAIKREERKLEKQLGKLQHQLDVREAAKALGRSVEREVIGVEKRVLSAAGRAAIVKATKKRWAKVGAQSKWSQASQRESPCHSRRGQNDRRIPRRSQLYFACWIYAPNACRRLVYLAKRLYRSKGVEPDVEVENSPESLARNFDAQMQGDWSSVSRE
jgi:hypothetical protein